MEAVFCIHIEWQNQPMVFLLTLQIFYSFFKFIRKYFETYNSVVWSKHNLSIVCPFSDITIGGILGNCNINFEAKRVFALACSRCSDSVSILGMMQRKVSRKKQGGGVGFPPFFPLLSSAFTTPLSISCHSPTSECHGKYLWIPFLVER